jgi:enoyl-CoA hydratase
MVEEKAKSSFKNIRYEVKHGIGYVTVNRPKVLNALNLQTILELMAAFSKIKNDSGVHAAIITGAGEKAFVAGADIAELAALGSVAGKDFALRGQAVFNFIEELGKPVIAAVNGFALGGGCELAMACTIRIAGESAKFGQPEVNLGIIPGYGGTQRLPRLVGRGKALELILTGDMIDARTAFQIGLVNAVVPSAELIPACEKLLGKILKKGPIAVRLCIEAVNQGLRVPIREGLSIEANLFGLACSTEDMKEGTKAFLEKRDPKFKGQ